MRPLVRIVINSVALFGVCWFALCVVAGLTGDAQWRAFNYLPSLFQVATFVALCEIVTLLRKRGP